MPVTDKHQEIQHYAKTLYAAKTDWVTFYREILGVNGAARKAFPTRQSLAEFEQSKAYRDIQRMLTRLRRKGAAVTNPDETTRVITVRLPKSLHQALIADAHEHCTSMNKLCISKLLQFIDDGMVPNNP
jgi:predicted HicB family RNase H-like nuclease